ncbi:MAG: T9SS type A sorting domain-containing protein, partial [Lewinella sp.]|nr:T9SS type A sorting domain-containing protein [Lewinella sp.]
NNPGGFGQRDALLSVLNPEFESDCTQDYPVDPIPLNLVITAAQAPFTSPVIPTPLALQTAVNIDWQTTSPCSTGGCGECATDQIILNTGYDPVNGTTYPAGTYDGLWSLVESPDAGITVPRPAYVVAANTAWANQTNTGWISAYPQSNLNSNNPKPNAPYGFRRCFCICDDDSDITISLNALADNNVEIYLEDDLGNDIPPTIVSITSTGTSAFQTVTSGTMSYTLNAGTYCLRADLRNLSGVAMGLNIQGAITGENLVETLCCTNAGGITGAKFHDLDCNGKWDNPGPNGEPGIPNWQIVLCDTLGNPLDTVLTDAFGYYTFPNVAPGVYMVKEINQSGWAPSTPPTGAYTVVVDPLQIVGPLDFGNCRSCGDFVEEEVNFSCDPLGSYEYTFQLQNHTGDLVTSFVLNNLPAGYTFTPQYFSQWTNPAELPIAANGGISGPLSITITPPAPITVPTEICFDVVLFSGANECCHFTHCITLEPIDPCQVEVTATAIDSDEGCCYDITVTNDYCDNFFTVLVTEILTPGVVFSSYNGGSTWDVTEDNLNHRLSWAPAGGGNIPTGTFGDMTICLGGIMSQTQKPQYVAFHWMSVNAAGEEYIACSDTLEFNCEGCVIVSEENIVCNEDGTYSYSMTVTNNSNPAHFVSNVVLEVYSTTIAFTPNVFNVALNGGQSAPIGPITITGGNPGDVVWFKTLILDTDGWCCHLDSLSITLPDCGGCACPPFEEYVQNVNAGFTFAEDCPEVNFTAVAGTECDLVEWEFLLPGQPPVTVQGKGDETVSFTFPGAGGYGVCMTLIPINEDGKRCFDEAIRYCEDIIVTCGQNVDCIDQNQIDLTVVCPAVFDPVCGCDGVTYSNACAAENWGGVTSWTSGPCPQGPNDPNNPNVINLPNLDETAQEIRPNLHVDLTGKHRIRFAGLMRSNADGVWEAIDIENADFDGSDVKLNLEGTDPVQGQYEVWATDAKGRLYRTPYTAGPRPLSLNLYPNPVRDELTLRFGSEGRYSVELYNANGSRMLTRSFDGFNATLSVDQLPDGVYILRAMDDQGRITQQRFVKTAR